LGLLLEHPRPLCARGREVVVAVVGFTEEFVCLDAVRFDLDGLFEPEDGFGNHVEAEVIVAQLEEGGDVLGLDCHGLFELFNGGCEIGLFGEFVCGGLVDVAEVSPDHGVVGREGVGGLKRGGGFCVVAGVVEIDAPAVEFGRIGGNGCGRNQQEKAKMFQGGHC